MTAKLTVLSLLCLLFATPSFAGDPMGLDIVPFDSSVMMLENIQKTYDPKQPERLIGITGTTAAAPNVIVNYFHSLLLQQGWKSVGTVSAQGARLVRQDEQIFITTMMDTGQYHTRMSMRLESVHLSAEGIEE